MKKIIGIIAAVAMASSVFAVDVAARIKWGRNSLLDVPFNGGKISALQLAQPVGYVDHSAFGFKVSVSGDKAGAAFEIAPGYNPGSINFDHLTTWLQPIDQLKVVIGGNDFGYGAETIDYSKINDISGDGFGIIVMPIDGLKINLFALPGLSSPWYTEKAWVLNGDLTGKCGASVGYSAGFGSINLSYMYTAAVADSFKQKPVKVKIKDANGKEIEVETTELSWQLDSKGSPEMSTIGIGYDGAFGGVNLGVHGKFDITDKLSGVTADLFVATGFDAVGIKAYAKFGTDLDKTNTLNIRFLATYGLSFGTVYLNVNNVSNGTGDAVGNLLKDPFMLCVQPGLQWNIGAAACDVGVAFVIKGSNCTMRVPFSVNIGF